LTKEKEEMEEAKKEAKSDAENTKKTEAAIKEQAAED